MIGLMVVHYASLCKSLHVPSSLCICIGMEWSWLICTEKIWNGPGSYVLRKFILVILEWSCSIVGMVLVCGIGCAGLWCLMDLACVCGIGSCGLGDGSRVCGWVMGW